MVGQARGSSIAQTGLRIMDAVTLPRVVPVTIRASIVFAEAAGGSIH